jgi:SAM-dependent methyltransferase
MRGAVRLQACHNPAMPKAAGEIPFYLYPYHDARRQGARGFDALLWASREGQRVRFEAIARRCPLADRRILDAGCGRADLLGYLLDRGILPAHYTGLEGIPASLRAARRKKYPRCEIRKADFVRQPEKLRVGADVVIFSGSLNTLSRPQFYRTLHAAWEATGEWLVFNFLTSRFWFGENWLSWHRRSSVLAYCRSLGGEPGFDESYIPGDCTIAVRKPGAEDRTPSGALPDPLQPPQTT